MMKRCSSFCELQRALEQNTHTQKKKKSRMRKREKKKKCHKKYDVSTEKGAQLAMVKKLFSSAGGCERKRLLAYKKKKSLWENKKKGEKERLVIFVGGNTASVVVCFEIPSTFSALLRRQICNY